MKSFNPAKCDKGRSQDHINNAIDQNFRLLATVIKELNNSIKGPKFAGTSKSGGNNGGGGGGPGPGKTFIGLNDTPGSYNTQGEKIVRVKANETGLEFIQSADNDLIKYRYNEVAKTYTGLFVTSVLYKLAGVTVETLTLAYDSDDNLSTATTTNGGETITYTYAGNDELSGSVKV